MTHQAQLRYHTISPSLIPIIVVLGSALLVVSYCKIFTKYCKASRSRPFCRRRHRILDSKENIQEDDCSLEEFQDPEGWQIITQSYGLDEVVIRSIPLCRLRMIYVVQSSKSLLFNYGFQNILYLDLFGRTASFTLKRFSYRKRFWFTKHNGGLNQNI